MAVADNVTDNGTETTVKLGRVIAAPAERVFRAWTNPEQLMRWFCPYENVKVLSAEIDARVGGEYRITMIGGQQIPFSVAGSYSVVRPYAALEFTWIWEDPDLDVGETIVRLQFTEQGNSTEFTLTHDLIPTAEKRDSHATGWSAILESLSTYLGAAE